MSSPSRKRDNANETGGPCPTCEQHWAERRVHERYAIVVGSREDARVHWDAERDPQLAQALADVCAGGSDDAARVAVLVRYLAERCALGEQACARRELEFFFDVTPMQLYVLRATSARECHRLLRECCDAMDAPCDEPAVGVYVRPSKAWTAVTCVRRDDEWGAVALLDDGDREARETQLCARVCALMRAHADTVLPLLDTDIDRQTLQTLAALDI